MTPVIDIQSLQAGYGQANVLNDFTLNSGSSTRIGLFGPNGHGKTTLLNVISGIIPPRSGSIRFDNSNITALPPKDIVDLGIIHVAQGSMLFPQMSVMENLRLGAWRPRARATSKDTLNKIFDLFPKLKIRRNQTCRTLSGGERQMVAIGIGLMGAPKLLMLDEPTLGLAPKIKEELCEAIGTISQAGLPLIIVEQDIEFLLTLTEKLFMVTQGNVTLEMSPDNRLDHGDIMDMYFGGDAHA